MAESNHFTNNEPCFECPQCYDLCDSISFCPYCQKTLGGCCFQKHYCVPAEKTEKPCTDALETGAKTWHQRVESKLTNMDSCPKCSICQVYLKHSNGNAFCYNCQRLCCQKHLWKIGKSVDAKHDDEFICICLLCNKDIMTSIEK